MKITVGLWLALVSSLPFMTAAAPKRAPVPQARPEKPGDAGRAALRGADFMIGAWEGEGWSLTPSGEKERFWIEEDYRYRGDKDLMDMEGRFGAILPDGTKAADRQYALGLLYYDGADRTYKMWHYNSEGTVFTVDMIIDAAGRSAWYARDFAGREGRFKLTIGKDGLWTTTLDLLRSDRTWTRVMEFRMRRRPG